MKGLCGGDDVGDRGVKGMKEYFWGFYEGVVWVDFEFV